MQHIVAGENWEDYDLVFPNLFGRPVEPTNLIRDFKKVMEKAKLPRIRIHDLRHTSATLMLLMNIHPKVVSERLGHSDIRITLQLYSHAIPTLQTEAATSIDLLTLGRPPPPAAPIRFVMFAGFGDNPPQQNLFFARPLPPASLGGRVFWRIFTTRGGRLAPNPPYVRPRQDSNPQPTDPKSGALSIELRGRSEIIPQTWRSWMEFFTCYGIRRTSGAFQKTNIVSASEQAAKSSIARLRSNHSPRAPISRLPNGEKAINVSV